jgi:hypothetical protein
VEEWEIMFEPGAVVVVDYIFSGPGLDPPELKLERYELVSGLLRACTGEAEVRAVLVEMGVSDKKADAVALRIWQEMTLPTSGSPRHSSHFRTGCPRPGAPPG